MPGSSARSDLFGTKRSASGPPGGVPRPPKRFLPFQRDKVYPPAGTAVCGEEENCSPLPFWLSASCDETWSDVAVGNLCGKRWTQTVLRSDPPSLSLKPLTEQPGDVSTGSLHAEEDRENYFSSTYSSGKESSMYKKDGDTITVKGDCVGDLVRGLLLKVRYPPETIQCSWKVMQRSHRSSRAGAATPEDIRGPLPRRPFTLLDNASDSLAAQPPNFTEHPLRPEQLRSLSWMLSRERHQDLVNADDIDDPFALHWRRFLAPGQIQEVQHGEHIVSDARVRIREGIVGEGIPHVGEGIVRSRVDNTAHVVWDGGCAARPVHTSYANVDDLEFFDTGVLAPGCYTRLKPGLSSPAFGWGGVTAASVGILLQMDPASDIALIRFPTHPKWKGKLQELEYVSPDGVGGEASLCVLDVRLRATYPVLGGILADKIGYGKTATTIGLIDATSGQPAPLVPDVEDGGFIPAKGTLIIVPSNLFDQWLGEFSKFLANGQNIKKGIVKGWSNPSHCPLSIFAMSNVTPLTKVKARELAEADVVLCSYRLLFSTVYQARRKELAECSKLSSLVTKTRQLLRGQTRLRTGRKGDNYCANWSELEFPLLELFYWRRVVFDEFHELESFDSTQQNSLQHLRSHCRWGLTGTPPVESNAGVIFMSSLFRIDVPGDLDNGDALEKWESDRLVSETAGSFLDYFCRQNTAELPHIGLEEHVVVVRHTAAERALYLGQAHDAPDVSSPQAFATEERVTAIEKLLKLCSHFQSVGDVTATAKEECLRTGEQKERRVTRARNSLQRCCRVIVLLEAKLSGVLGAADFEEARPELRKALDTAKERLRAEGDKSAKAVRILDEAEEQAASEPSAERFEVHLTHHRPKDEALAARLGPMDCKQGYHEQWRALARVEMVASDLSDLLKGQAKEQAQLLQEMHEAAASLEFFRRTVATLAQDNQGSERSCTVCLEDDLPLSKLAITPCAHTFCMDCLKATITKFKSCSICRAALTLKDARPLTDEIEPSSATGATEEKAKKGGENDEESNKHGTKLAAVVRKLLELRASDPTVKVILFVQFDDLKKKVASTLQECGVPATQLQGSVAMRSQIISEWQNNPHSASFVLLLSLAQSASGTNLTAASHVMFLHPMLAPTAERAVGYELQAIGRARRHGQRRPSVHVWRFVTADTVEQAITERHQSALWDRERARETSGAT